jgi:hypothetical protein
MMSFNMHDSLSAYRVTQYDRVESGANPRGGGAAGLQPAPNPAKPKFKKHFVGTISKVLHDFPFSRSQPLKSADYQYIRIFKNKLIKLKKIT